MLTTLNLDLPHFDKFSEDDQKVLTGLLELSYLKILYGLELEGKRRLLLSDPERNRIWLPPDELKRLIDHHLI